MSAVLSADSMAVSKVELSVASMADLRGEKMAVSTVAYLAD